MRFRLTCNAAGDIRVTADSDRPHIKPIEPPAGGSLVRCEQLQDWISTGHFATRAGYGWQPDGVAFSKHARKVLRECGAVFDKTGKDRCVFLTGTLPGSTIDACAAIARYSAWVTSRLGQWFRETFRGSAFFGVWEYQKRGALHLHVCVRVSSADESARLRALWHHRWCTLLAGVDRRSMVDVYARGTGGTWRFNRDVCRTDAQTVVKSVGRYLSKYLTKDAARAREASAFPPSRWMMVSANLRREVQANRVEVTLKNMPPNAVLELFERVAGEVVSRSPKVHSISNPYDNAYKGVLALCDQSEAHQIFDDVSAMVNAWMPRFCGTWLAECTRLPSLAHYWQGRLLQNSS